MHNFGIFFLWALAACILFDGSLAKSPRFDYTILLTDMDPNQTELRPLLGNVVQEQDTENTNDADIATKVLAKLDSMAEQQAKLEGQLQGVEAKLEGQLQEMQTKLEAKLDESLLTVQKKIEIQLQALANQLQAMSNNKIDAAEESQLQAKSNKTAAPQKTAKVEVPASSTITIPSGFELIGTRYFRIVYEEVDWYTAERMCRKMGGYLASFRNEEEMNAVIPKLDNWPAHWLGINDEENEGHFVTVASHKPAPFLKWHKEQPNDKDHEENCVNLFNAEMWDSNCNDSLFFICQADNEI